jgi:nicotinamidase-related amidase
MAKISRMVKTLGSDHTGLVLFDTLQGYLHSKDPKVRGLLDGRDVLRKLQALLGAARAAGLTTFYPAAAHAGDGSDTVARLTDTDLNGNPLDGSQDYVTPPIYKESGDSEIALELKPAPGDVLVPKHRWNSFFCTDLEFHLKVRGIDTIILAGGATDIGIASTAFAARDLDLGLVIVRDCCFSARQAKHDFFIDEVFPSMARVLDLSRVISLMDAKAADA